jgi:hypothetical protein
MAVSTPENDWTAIDEAIFANLKLPAIKQICALKGCGIGDATEILTDRYKKLRTESPDRFSCSDEEYWANFYS